MHKVIVKVNAQFNENGQIFPIAVVWEDGRTFEVDRILDVRQAASLKAGGQGIRYTCRIRGKQRYLWFENPVWFVEGRE